GEPVELGQMLLARQYELGGGQRVRKLARFLCDLERIKAGDADREHDREPDTDQIDRRQDQRLVAVPRQRLVKKNQQRRAGNGQQAERDGQPHRQRGRRDQDRRQEQERKRILKAAGEEQEG